jgi:transposase
MLDIKLAQFASLPELIVHKVTHQKGLITLHCSKKRSPFEICPRCAQPSSSFYDHRTVQLRDEPLRKVNAQLLVVKHRYYCKNCRKPFTEPLKGVLPRQRSTQRFKRTLLWAVERMRSMKAVRDTYQCSSSMLYKTVYEHLELKLRQYKTPWPEVVGIDEHFFSRRKGYSEFFTVFTDIKRHKVREAVLGRSKKEVLGKIEHIEHVENVKWCIMDLSETYRSLAKEKFPKAQIVADKFHVLRLLSPALRKKRIEITGDRRTLRIKRLLQKNRHRLNYFDRTDVDQFLKQHPDLNEIYRMKERMHELYRCKGLQRATINFDRLITQAQNSSLPELKKLAHTLIKWKAEILNYFITGYTNAMTEGFNRVASLVKNLGFGYKNPDNYRLRYLSACAT